MSFFFHYGYELKMLVVQGRLHLSSQIGWFVHAESKFDRVGHKDVEAAIGDAIAHAADRTVNSSNMSSFSLCQL